MFGGARGQVRIVGAYEPSVKIKGKQIAVGFVTDAASGQLLGMEVL